MVPTPSAPGAATVCRLRASNGWVVECASWPQASWMAQLRGGLDFSDGGICGFLTGHERRNEIHEEAQTQPFRSVQGSCSPGGDSRGENGCCAAHHEVHPTQVTAWKTQLLEDAPAIFGGEAVAADERERIRELHEKISELTVERDFSYGPSCVNWHRGNSRVGHDSDLPANE